MNATCLARSQQVRHYAARQGIGGQSPYPASYTEQEVRESIARRLAWDSFAAGEYARPVLSDATDVAAICPDLTDEVWHHAAGAVIAGGYCCGTPASHRDALVSIAAELIKVTP